MPNYDADFAVAQRQQALRNKRNQRLAARDPNHPGMQVQMGDQQSPLRSPQQQAPKAPSGQGQQGTDPAKRIPLDPEVITRSVEASKKPMSADIQKLSNKLAHLVYANWSEALGGEEAARKLFDNLKKNKEQSSYFRTALINTYGPLLGQGTWSLMLG